MYKLFNDLNGKLVCINHLPSGKSFGAYTDNIDYLEFKTAINADEAQLEDADGNLMTAQEAKDYVATLP